MHTWSWISLTPNLLSISYVTIEVTLKKLRTVLILHWPGEIDDRGMIWSLGQGWCMCTLVLPSNYYADILGKVDCCWTDQKNYLSLWMLDIHYYVHTQLYVVLLWNFQIVNCRSKVISVQARTFCELVWFDSFGTDLTCASHFFVMLETLAVCYYCCWFNCRLIAQNNMYKECSFFY